MKRGTSHDHRTQARLHHPPTARRPAARPDHRQPRRADLPDHQLPVPRHRARRQSVRPEGVRQHLHPHHEPDHRRARAAPGQTWKAASARWRPVSGHAAQAHGDPHPVRRGRPHRHQQPALRRHLQPVRLHLPAHRHRRDLRRSDRPGRLREGDPAQHQDPLRRDAGQSRHQRLPVRGGGGAGQAARASRS